MTFNNEIERVKAQIFVLEKKLALLEEMKKTKTPCEEAFKEFYGAYPITDIADTSWDSDGWVYFEAGYNAAQKDYKVGEFQEPEEQVSFVPKEIKELVKEGLKWCKEHPNESVEDYLTPKTPEKRKIDDLAEKLLPDDHPYKIADEHGETNPYKQGLNMIKKDKETEELMTSKGYEKNSAGFWEPKPQTHEEVSDGLKEAFREAVKQGIIPEVDKVSEVFMNEMVAELKGQTLTDIIWNWWGNVFTSNEDWDAENAIEHLVDLIEALLPKPQNAAGSQNAYVESAVEGFNDCLNTIKRKL